MIAFQYHSKSLISLKIVSLADLNDSDSMKKQMASLKMEVKQLKDELKRAEKEYRTKLNNQIAELRKEIWEMLGSRSAGQSPDSGLDACKGKYKNLVSRVAALEKKTESPVKNPSDKEFVFNFRVDNVRELFESIGSSRVSEVFAFQNLKYQLVVRTKEIRNATNAKKNGRYMSFNLYYCGPQVANTQLFFELRILSRQQGTANRVAPVNYTIKGPGSYGFSEYIREEKLFDKNFGFIKKNSMILQAFLKSQK